MSTHERKPQLITYTRQKKSQDVFDSLRKSLADGERRILKDITNQMNQRSLGSTIRKPISLNSPQVGTIHHLPTKINTIGNSIHSGMIGPSVADPPLDKISSSIFVDPEPSIVPSIIPRKLEIENDKNVGSFWSPSSVVTAGNAFPAPKVLAISKKAHQELFRDFTVNPNELRGKVWICKEPRKLQPSNLPDHF